MKPPSIAASWTNGIPRIYHSVCTYVDKALVIERKFVPVAGSSPLSPIPPRRGGGFVGVVDGRFPGGIAGRFDGRADKTLATA